ncbi:MAG: hypothetical protein WD768_20250 [Phycisphaeraceae bacterium]
MSVSTNRSIPIVFFCLAGLIYTGQALAADGAASANPDGPAKVNIFENPTTTTPSNPADADIPSGQTVKAGSFGEIDLHVKDLDVSTVLQLLSIQSKRNIIATKEVTGTVTADLYSVDFYDALDAILNANGFGFREKGKFIYVYTSAQLAEIQKSEEKPLVKVLRLNYLNARDASTYITPLLSAAGSISLSGQVPPGMAPSVGDAGSNSSPHMDTLVLRDLQANLDQIIIVIKELDIRPKQVTVKATVLQARLSEKNAWGVDITVLGGGTIDDFTTPLSVIDDLTKGTVKPTGHTSVASSTAGNAASGPATFRFGYLSGSIEMFVRALDQVTDTTVIAKPEILVLNRQRADLLIGGRLGYISTQQTETSTTQTVEFLDIGTQLTVRPFVSDDNMIRLELRPSISTGRVTPLGGFVVPETETQELTTNIMVKSGMTVVIGGLFQESTQVDRSQVPGIGDIPILGAAAKGIDDKVDRSEVIFLITPTVMKDEVLYAQGERAMDSADYAQYGAREGLLIWSRTKRTSAYMQDALALYKEGKTDLALEAANKALYLDSTIVDARRIKAAVLGNRLHVYERSILTEIVNNNVNTQLKAAPSAKVEPATGKPGAKAAASANDAPVITEPVPATEGPFQPVKPEVDVPIKPASDTTPAPKATEPDASENPDNAIPVPAPASDAEASNNNKPVNTPNEDGGADRPADDDITKRLLDEVKKLVEAGIEEAPKKEAEADADSTPKNDD